ncbi:efflux RND transporter periplasmic adaptor subunit [Pontivivens ytuae]|uniref:Efflux RND transporter periplasmic adaptor subunit n=1 Tax=Pontivivens ytuae TaxID=2789856 RepID=A0A7S9LVH7_9RHOB|nr:efflux RND transporter periplasmic adaptor subunit [Pontivivens ytuae]QPH56052.1 efflux RND transporter periplasmic adaptor subunit [Pontivivens ytuae]
MSKKPLLAALLLGTSLAGGYHVYQSQLGAATAAPAPEEAPLPRVVVAAAVEQPVTEWDRYPARFSATEAVEVSARVSGHLVAVHFEEGQIVEQGQPLFTIDQRPFEAALRLAEAEVAEARARVGLAQVELDRVSQLVANGHSSQSQGDVAEAEMASAAASLAAAEARAEQAALDLDYTIVRSPISGRIDETRLDPGSLVRGIGVGAETLTSIVALDPIHVVFDVDQNALLRYNRLALEGVRGSSRTTPNPVRVTLPDGSDATITGQMDFVANQIDEGTGTIRARALVPNTDFLLTPGMFARVDLLARPDAPTVLIPDQAIAIEQTSRTVLVVDAEGTVESRVIETGPLHEGLRVVRHGLEPGEQVIVEGRHRARPGATVAAETVEDAGLNVASAE